MSDSILSVESTDKFNQSQSRMTPQPKVLNLQTAKKKLPAAYCRHIFLFYFRHSFYEFKIIPNFME